MENIILEKLLHFGVVSRDQVRNDHTLLRRFLRFGFVKKVSKRGRVFYELTNKALPLMDDYRQILLQNARIRQRLAPQSKFYQALLEDIRFLDEYHPEAEDFRLLGDWQLKRPIVESQIELAKQRYYYSQGLP